MNSADYEAVDLQKVVITWFDRGARPLPQTTAFASENARHLLAVETEFLHPEPYYYEDQDTALCVFGIPILHERIDNRRVAREFLANQGRKSFLSSLNGVFFLVHFDKKKDQLQVVNDRFSGYPLYMYHKPGFFMGSFGYNDLFSHLRDCGELDLSEEAFFELWYFRRLLGTKTLDRKSFYMPPANVLSFDGTRMNLDSYWAPDYTKEHRYSVRENGVRLGQAIKRSITQRTTDGKRYGLFLSGGLDTRTVLSAFPFPPICFTATSVKEGNREYERARELARLKGSQHFHLPVGRDHYSRIIDPSVRLTGGLYTSSCIFIGFRDFLRSKIDVGFHGHGFDYMFQGMYIPARYLQPFSLPLVARRMKCLGEDLVSDFIHTVSYRLKYPHMFRFVKEEHRRRIRESLHESAKDIYRKALDLSDNPHDHWEYMTFHHLSRHYSYPDYASIHTNVEQRPVAFDNEIYDMYLTLPTEQRFDARVQRAALRYLSPAHAQVPSANDGLPVTSSYVKSLYQIRNWALRALRGRLKNRPLDDREVRTWSTIKWRFLNDDYFADRLRNLGDSPNLQRLAWLDTEELRRCIEEFQRNPDMQDSKYLCDAFWGLVNIDLFLEQLS